MPNWLGFVIIIAIGAGLIVVGAVGHPVGIRYMLWGIWAIVSAVIAWISGATSQPGFTSEDTFGGIVEKIQWWAWVIIAVSFVAVLILGFVVGPNK